MSIINALNGLIADAIDHLAERVSKTPASRRATRSVAFNFINSPAHGDGRDLIAKIARSEVKNYLAELAEQAEVPFEGPAQFLRSMRAAK